MLSLSRPTNCKFMETVSWHGERDGGRKDRRMNGDDARKKWNEQLRSKEEKD